MYYKLINKEVYVTVPFDYLIDTAVEAGKRILDIYNAEDYTVTRKSDASPLTDADTASHRVIKERLTSRYPHIPLISEEGRDIPYETRAPWDRYWLIDPLDGTKEFISRNGEFTVNIALIEHNKPVLGVIYVPVQDAVYYGSKQAGAFRIAGGTTSALSVNDKKAPMTGACSRSHAHQREQDLYAALGIENTTSAGSSLKFCLVAECRALVYYRHNPTMEWDTGAGHAIAGAAGARVYNLVYNKADMKNSSFIVAGAVDDKARHIIKQELGL